MPQTHNWYRLYSYRGPTLNDWNNRLPTGSYVECISNVLSIYSFKYHIYQLNPFSLGYFSSCLQKLHYFLIFEEVRSVKICKGIFISVTDPELLREISSQEIIAHYQFIIQANGAYLSWKGCTSSLPFLYPYKSSLFLLNTCLHWQISFTFINLKSLYMQIRQLKDIFLQNWNVIWRKECQIASCT